MNEHCQVAYLLRVFTSTNSISQLINLIKHWSPTCTDVQYRHVLSLQGSMLDDFCVGCFCAPCVLCQLSREVKLCRRTGQMRIQGSDEDVGVRSGSRGPMRMQGRMRIQGSDADLGLRIKKYFLKIKITVVGQMLMTSPTHCNETKLKQMGIYCSVMNFICTCTHNTVCLTFVCVHRSTTCTQHVHKKNHSVYASRICYVHSNPRARTDQMQVTIHHANSSLMHRC